MAHISADKFAYSSGKTQRVKLLCDQKIKGVACKKGDTCELSLMDANYLKSIERVEFISVAADPVASKTVVTR